jgi:(p)ppGpp synthase/HD superfamily hydrolase
MADKWLRYYNKHTGAFDIDTLLQATVFAAIKHEGQVRKDAESTPYIIHPIGVAYILWTEGNIRNVNVLTAALLHDTLEDTETTAEEIESLFGSRVRSTVEEVTNDPALSSEENKQRQVDHAPNMSMDAQLVKLADRLYNIRDLKNAAGWDEEKILNYVGWGEKLLEALKGTNKSLEKALEKEIHKQRENIH